jgi:archaellum component FlaC
MEDNELIALLDRKFAQVDARFEQMDRRFDRMDTRFAQMDTNFDNLRIEAGARIDGMHSDIKKIAEGVSNVDEKLDRFRDETITNLVDIRRDLRVSFSMLNGRITDLEKTRS